MIKRLVSFHLTPAQYAKLNAHCKRVDKSRLQLFREFIDNLPAPPDDTPCK